jgi:hypothetical protein
MSKRDKKSPFSSTSLREAGGFIRRIHLGKHKHDERMWKKELLKARAKWSKAEHDDEILKAITLRDLLHEDEVEAVIKWECFRYLYFTGQLSQFWNKAIEGSRYDALEACGSLKKTAYLSDGSDSFGAPWSAWSDHPSFPAMSWHEAKRHPKFESLLYSAPQPNKPAELLRADVRSWSLLYYQSLAAIESLNDDLQICPENEKSKYLIGMDKPLMIQPHAKKTTVIALEVDWDSTKSEIRDAIWQEIEQIWKQRSTKKMGPKKQIAPILNGLVTLRRQARGDGRRIYARRPDGGPIKAEKEAIRNAEVRLNATKEALCLIEAELRQN